MIDEREFYDDEDFMDEDQIKELELKRAISELIRQKNAAKNRE